MPIVGVLLAGGLSRRMSGGDKSFALLDGRPLIVYVAERLLRQVDTLIVNANGDPARYAALGLPVVADRDDSHGGPLFGILAGMDWARANAPAATTIATVAIDTPFIPLDLVPRLAAASDDAATIRLAASGGRTHQVIGLWPVELREALERWLAEGKSRAVRDWLGTRRHIATAFDLRAGVDPFFNINTPEDLDRAQTSFFESGR